MPPITFSVVIPTCNRPELLRACLDALAPGVQTFVGSVETIVTDDGREPVAELLKTDYPWVQWVQGPRRGPAANRNKGATQARGEWLVFTDDDCIPEVGWLDHYARGIVAYPKARAFEGSIHPRGDLNRDLAECPVNLTGDCFWSANICVQQRLFASLNGFDERFRIAAHEDQDLFLRLKKHTEIPFMLDAAVSHPVRYGSLRGWLKQMNSMTANWLLFAKTHADELDYHNDMGILAAGYAAQIMLAYRSVKQGYPRQLCKSLTMLFCGLPYGAYRLLVRKDLGTTSSRAEAPS